MKGTGSIYLRGGVWWMKFYARGRAVRESTGQTSEVMARRVLRNRLGDPNAHLKARRLTFDDMAIDLQNHYDLNGLRTAGRQAARLKHLRRAFRGIRALHITAPMIRAFVLERKKEGAANATINRDLAALSKMFTLARDAGMLASIPKIERLAEAGPRAGFLNLEQFVALRAALPEYLRDPVEFLYRTGWRVSEMRSLQWRDVDLPDNRIVLRAENSKNKRARVFPMTGELQALIKRAKRRRNLGCKFVFHYRRAKKGHGARCYSITAEGDLSVPSDLSNGAVGFRVKSNESAGGLRHARETRSLAAALMIGDFRKAWANACEAAELGSLLVHDLRRSAVRNMVRAGISEKLAMNLSGHRTRAIFDRYNITSEDDLRAAAGTLDAYLKNVPEMCPDSAGTADKSRVSAAGRKAKSGQ